VAAIDHRIIMPSGEVQWQHWSDRAIFDRTGKIIEYQSVGRDTTRQKNAEEKLKLAYEELNVAYEQLTATEEELRQNYEELGNSQTELHSAYEQLTATEEELRQNYDELSKSQLDLIRSEERYRSVVEDQTEFICRFSPEGKLTFVNDAYCRYFNLDRDCIGKPHTVVLPPEDIPLMEEQLSQLSPANPVAAIDHRIIMPSGEVRWQHWSDRAIFDRTGKIIEYQSVGRDITDRKRVEQALDESNKKLNLLSNITRHDILNQLTVLQGSLGLLELEIANPDQRRLISKAIQSSDVIRGQISFTQQYQDIGVQKPRWQNLHAAVTTVCMDDGFTNVSIDPHLETWEVYADPLLRTVFLNLFENAEMHGGKVTRIAVSGTETPECLVITVDDDGDGIAPDDKERIFRKGIGKHTGLGLFLVQEVLGITGLSIRETGEFGRGARFEIHIPMGIYRKTGHAQDR
jgi:PAS domain S-box-containing protein